MEIKLDPACTQGAFSLEKDDCLCCDIVKEAQKKDNQSTSGGEIFPEGVMSDQGPEGWGEISRWEAGGKALGRD